MRVFKKENKWWIDYNVNGKRVRKSVSTNKAEAQKVLTKIQSDIIHNKYALPKNQKIKFKDFANEFTERHKAISEKTAQTIKYLLRILIPHFGNFNIDEITDYHYDKYRNMRINQKAIRRKGTVNPSTINREGKQLLSMLNKAVKWGYLSFNPIKDMVFFREEPRERILTQAEMRQLISNAKAPLKHIILIALNTGMRKAEILNLEWNQVNVLDNFIIVKKTKTGTIRRIPLNPVMKELLQELELQKGERRYVIKNTRGDGPFKTIPSGWSHLLKETGITDFKFHDLRHCFATYALLSGGDIISLKETLGHSTISTTARYTKALMAGQIKLVNGFVIGESKGEIVDFPKQEMKEQKILTVQ